MSLRSSFACIGRLSGPLASLTARNAASNYVALAWLSVLSMLTVPVYIRLLGVAEWGVVAACASLQIVSNFVDAGFSQIVPRWAAREGNNPLRLRQYWVLFRRIYGGLGLLVFAVLQASAGYLSQQWFQVPADQAHELEMAIRIVSFQFLFQFINNLHTGLWYGLQQQMLANVRACAFGTLKHGVALAALSIGSPQAWVYVLAFSTVAFLEVAINAVTVRRMVGRAPAGGAAPAITIGPVLKEVSVLSGGILIGLLVSQLDRIILSRTVDIESFGIYTVVATLALALLQLQTPVTRAYFPVLVQDFHATGMVSAVHLRRLLTGTVLSSTIPALLLCVFAPQVLSLWLHNPKMVEVGADPLRLLLLAVAINSIYGCVYQVILAAGKSGRVLAFNLTALVIATLAVLAVGGESGILLGGVIWLANTCTQLSLGVFWLVRQSRVHLQS